MKRTEQVKSRRMRRWLKKSAAALVTAAMLITELPVTATAAAPEQQVGVATVVEDTEAAEGTEAVADVSGGDVETVAVEELADVLTLEAEEEVFAESEKLAVVEAAEEMSGTPSKQVLETKAEGDWTIDTTAWTATFKGLDGLTFYFNDTNNQKGAIGDKTFIGPSSTNGSASNGIVVVDKKSYIQYVPANSGTLTLYVKNANTKTGYISKTKGGVSEAVAEFVPGGTGEYDVTGVFKITQDAQMATLELEVEAGTTYYVCLSGSKMLCGGGTFVPYATVNCTITDGADLGSYSLKFTNDETKLSTSVETTSKTFTVALKPGTYSVALTGENAADYAVSNSTRSLKVEGTAQEASIELAQAISYIAHGTVDGFDEGYPINDLKVTFVPADKVSHANVEAEMKGASYSARLAADETYTVVVDGVYDYELSEEVTVKNETANAVAKDIKVKKRAVYEVTGKFLGLGETRGSYVDLAVNPSKITFTNVADKYEYTCEPANNAYSVSLRDGVYQAAVTLDGYSTITHVTVDGKATERNLLLKDETPKTVEYKETLEVGADKTYKTVQAAVDAATAMTRTDGQRVTILIDPGTYREQVVIDTPNLTFKSNGGNRNNTKITWYYGIGYKYYSCGADSHYDPYLDYDKYEKGNVVNDWGGAVILKKNGKGEGFRAEGITFENSFNKYMTDEEQTDGVEVNGLQSIKVVRRENTDVESKAATERAAAMVVYVDKTEFRDCAFIGSQDTLYTNNVGTTNNGVAVKGRAYYKNCYIEGSTDFIYGNGDVIFDSCELNVCGYSETASAAYLTAMSSETKYHADNGYIFRNCYISRSNSRKVGDIYYGRMWGENATVAFINSVLEEDKIAAAGWSEMSGKKPTDAGMQLVEYNTVYNGKPISTTGRVAGAVSELDQSKYTVDAVFVKNGWTPEYYVTEVSTAPEFSIRPTFTSNADINVPCPGNTVTAAYELGADWKGNDASVIAWYALAADYDKTETSLDKLLEKAELIHYTNIADSASYQLTSAFSGKYLMAVVTPMTTNGLAGAAAYVIASEAVVGDTWNDPSNPDSIEPGSGINIYLAGDSTVKDYSAKGMYMSGKIRSEGAWGEFLQEFFNSNYVQVNDYAEGGRSLRSFVNEGKLDNILGSIKQGDYLLIQFGHNDSSNGSSYYLDRFVPLYTPATKDSTTKGTNYPTSNFPTILPTESMKTATPSTLTNITASTYYAWDCGATYKGFIQYYIDAALEKGAIPVIVTPVSRLYYTNGKIRTHHDANMTDFDGTKDYMTEGDAYVTACKELYEENIKAGKNVKFIDMFGITKQLYEDAYTACGSDAYGKDIMNSGESTHSNKTGGMIQAGYMARALQDLKLSVSKYVTKPQTVYGENPDGEFVFTIKDGTFTAKNSSYVTSEYWSGIGQAVFDEVAKVAAEIAKESSDGGDDGKKTNDGDDKKTNDGGDKKTNDGNDKKTNDGKDQDGLHVTLVNGDEYTYTGKAITPTVVVTNNGETLLVDVDYTVKYANNIKAGAGIITITGKGSLAGKNQTNFKILPKNLDDSDVTVGNIVVASGSKAVPVIVYNGMKLGGKDYDITSDAKKKYTVDGDIMTVSGKGNYTSTLEIPVTVVAKADLKKFKVAVAKETFTYDGEPHTLAESSIVVTDAKSKETLAEGTDYEVVYPEDVTSAGTVKFSVIGMGYYTGCVTKTYKINPMKDAVGTPDGIDAAGYTYNPNGVFINEDLTVTVNGTELVEGVDYKISYSGNKKAGTAKYTVKFIGNYKGAKAVKGEFKINPANMEELDHSAFSADKSVKKASAVKSAPYVNVDGYEVKKAGMTVSYYLDEDLTQPMGKGSLADPKADEPATVYVKIEGKGNYTGTISTEYKVWLCADKTKDLSKAKILDKATGKKIGKQEYTGEELEPEVTVMIGSSIVPEDAYEVKYINNVNKGKATVIINAADSNSDGYAGGKAMNFSIVSRNLKTVGNLFDVLKSAMGF